MKLSIPNLLKLTTEGKIIMKKFELGQGIDTSAVCNLVIKHEFDTTNSYW